MPHQCTECGHTFPDGSKEMLSGCPDCGGTKFQFHPESAPEPSPEEPPDPPDRPESGVADTVGKAASTVRDLMGGSNAPDPRTSAGEEDPGTPSEVDSGADASPDNPSDLDTPSDANSSPGPADSPPETEGVDPDAEDAAQASARSDVVSADELPDPADRPDADRSDADRSDADRPAPSDGTVVSEPTGESPGLAELREELNDQFESIRIVEPGQYELNLMELYDRDEYIIALQENGKYSIQVPETWLGDDE